MNRIGIDVGGTNVKIALVNDRGEIKYSNSVPTRAEMGYEYTVENITSINVSKIDINVQGIRVK